MAKRRQFDLSSMMESMSGLPAVASEPQVQMIPLDDIIGNPANFYTIDEENLGKLADSIAIDGLQQYPIVMPHPKQSDKYLLISGHRRCAAIRLLVEGPDKREDLRLVPCTVKHYQSEAMAELQLILANSTSRRLSHDEISKQAERLERLLHQLKEEGYEFPGRMRDQVAKACQVSAPKLARLKVIRQKLKAPEFLLLFEKNKLTEQAAYALARLPEEFQQRLALIDPDISGGRAELVLKKYNEGWRWDPQLSCPNGKPCRRGDAFLRHDLDCCGSDMCGGETCCLDCGQSKETYYACSRMCSKAQALRKEGRDAKKAQEEEWKQARTRESQAETRINAQRLLRAIEAAGLPDDQLIVWEYIGGSSATVGELREYAAGIFPEKEYWPCAKFSPSNIREPTKIAQMLGCSTDYLLGVTDELTPQASAPIQEDAIPTEMVEALLEDVSAGPEAVHPVWLSGAPAQSGPVVARHVVDGLVVVHLCWYDGTFGCYRFSKTGADIDAECTGWWPVPADDSDGEGVSKLDTSEEAGTVGY